MQNRVFGVITGEVGAGKSTALRKPRHSLNPSDHRFLYLTRSSLGPRDLYRELLHRQRGITIVVVIDEAHLWDTLMLEEVRFLTNFGIDAASPLALILA